MKKLVVLDIPLYLENKLNKRGDVLIFIDAKRKDIQKRLKKRKYFSEKIHKKLKSLHLPLRKKRKLSNFVIKNTFNASKIQNDVKKIKTKILKI